MGILWINLCKLLQSTYSHGKIHHIGTFSHENHQSKKEGSKLLCAFYGTKIIKYCGSCTCCIAASWFSVYTCRYYGDTLLVYMKCSLIAESEATCKAISIAHVNLNIVAATVGSYTFASVRAWSTCKPLGFILSCWWRRHQMQRDAR